VVLEVLGCGRDKIATLKEQTQRLKDLEAKGLASPDQHHRRGRADAGRVLEFRRCAIKARCSLVQGLSDSCLSFENIEKRGP